jgi:uncharacterized coiled-coil protein SlyX
MIEETSSATVPQSFERIQRMQARFDALCSRLEQGFSSVPQEQGITEIEEAIASTRREEEGA